MVDHGGHKLISVIPADHKLNMLLINEKPHASFELIKENKVFDLFMDCEQGTIPPVGDAFNMTLVCDESLDLLENVYIEAGDHENLLRLTHENFESIRSNSKHLKLCNKTIH